MKSIRTQSHFLAPSECAAILNSVLSFKQSFPVPRVVRKCKERSLDYQVIDGHLIAKHFPEVMKLLPGVQNMVENFAGVPLTPLKNSRVAVNINITPPGGEYRWHYDRNAVTAILYLNEIEGGEVELFGNYRILLKSNHSSLQKFLDQILLSKFLRWIFSSKHKLIKPASGELLIMNANRCLHSVREVRGTNDRVCIVFAFDTPGKVHGVDADLDPYLYSEQTVSDRDPNYAAQ
jgi:2-oxoglutarate-Fe(II)-dependent oxygenase superfamily protein